MNKKLKNILYWVSLVFTGLTASLFAFEALLMNSTYKRYSEIYEQFGDILSKTTYTKEQATNIMQNTKIEGNLSFFSIEMYKIYFPYVVGGAVLFSVLFIIIVTVRIIAKKKERNK